MGQPSILKSHKHSKMIQILSYHLYFIMTGSKRICGLSVKSMTPNFVVFVSVLLPICCHIGWGMPYLFIFVDGVITLLCAITDRWV